MKKLKIRKVALAAIVMAGILVCQIGTAAVNTNVTQQWTKVHINDLKQDSKFNNFLNQKSLLYNLNKPISKGDYLELLTCSMNKEIVDSLRGQLDNFYTSNMKSYITRAEAVTIAGMICRLESYKEVNFADKQKISEEAYNYVSAFEEYGIVVGYANNTFMPEKNLTVAEAIVIVSKLVKMNFVSSSNVADFAGNKRGYNNGNAFQACFNKPVGLCDDGNNGIIVVDSFNNLIRRISNQKVETIAGKWTNKSDQYGIPIGGYINAGKYNAQFNKPQFATRNTNGDILVSDTENNSIRLISNSKVTALNSSILAGHKDGKLVTSLFNKPSDIVYDQLGNAYVADTMNNCIRYIDFNMGEVSTIAGKPSTPGLKDGPVSNALFNQPVGLALDKNGVLYVSDSGNQRIRKIDNGIVSTVAGSGESLLEGTNYIEGGYVDGKREQSKFNFPYGIDVNEEGIIFVADTGNHRIRAITNTGVTTIAGNGEASYFSGLPRASSFNEPSDVLVNGNKIYVSDTFNSKIRVINIDTSKIWD